MIGEIQGYTPRCAFVMGRNYRYKCKNQNYRGKGSFDKLGVIDYEGKDNSIPKQTQEAIDWLISLRTEGKHWGLEDHPELYPNMKNDSIYQARKKEFAIHCNEITQVWQCGVGHRETAISKGVLSWKDPKFSASLIDMKNQRGFTLDLMLEVNRNPDHLFLPTKMRRMNKFLEKHNKEYFVDFETISGAFDEMKSLPENTPINMIFMISIGCMNEHDKWECKTLEAKELSENEEKRIIDEFFKMVESNDCEVYHWSDAEPIMWNKVMKKYKMEELLKDKWTDLLHIFRNEPMVVKGCFSYSLKDIVKALHSHKLIDLEYDTDTTNGMSEMVNAYNAYQNNDTLEDVAKYNRLDCLALYKVLTFLRKI